MGTYLILRLKDKTDKNIRRINKELANKGARLEFYNGIPYGLFTSTEQIKEDARYMNEDEEGLKQSQHFKRPITVAFLKQFFWKEIGAYVLKISCPTEEELKELQIVIEYFKTNSKDFDTVNSKYLKEAMNLLMSV